MPRFKNNIIRIIIKTLLTKRRKEAGTKVDRQTKTTNIPENRNVHRLFYMKMNGRRIRRLLGDQHVSEDSGVAVFHGGG